MPDLQAGWEYRPLVRSSFDPLTNYSTSQDGTFRIEALSGLFIFLVKELFLFSNSCSRGGASWQDDKEAANREAVNLAKNQQKKLPLGIFISQF